MILGALVIIFAVHEDPAKARSVRFAFAFPVVSKLVRITQGVSSDLKQPRVILASLFESVVATPVSNTKSLGPVGIYNPLLLYHGATSTGVQSSI